MPSFNVQNAKSLEITDGNVATIHDADGRQLWGKLNYTTKYQGDTTQQTYSGKNLLDFKKFLTDRNVTYTEDADGGITFTLSNQLNSNKLVFSDTDITVSIQAEITNVTSTNAYIQLYNANNVRVARLSSTNPKAENVSACSMNMDWASSGRVTVKNVQLETGSTTTTYEPYVGGIPSPNPDYPQPINVVTGTQTVTIAGGTVSQDFTAHLGTLELAKIGSVQDYIYKSNGSWYKYTTIGKVTYVGTEEGWNQNTTTTGARYYIMQNDIGLPAYNGEGDDMMCYYFSGIRYDTYYSVGGVDGVTHSYSGNNAYMQIFFRTSFNGVNNFKTWLTTHNTTVYYVLATPTDTQITDTDLISELDAIEEWMTRCGYTASISGNLPIVINQTEIV